jgi:hypothetical protein
MSINKNLEAGLKTKLCAGGETVAIMNSKKEGTQKVYTAEGWRSLVTLH